MKPKKKHNPVIGIALGPGIGLALSLAFGANTDNPSQYMAYGLAFGAAAGALIDFFNLSK
jgi:lipoprotein signal peptidase